MNISTIKSASENKTKKINVLYIIINYVENNLRRWIETKFNDEQSLFSSFAYLSPYSLGNILLGWKMVRNSFCAMMAYSPTFIIQYMYHILFFEAIFAVFCSFSNFFSLEKGHIENRIRIRLSLFFIFLLFSRHWHE